MYKSFYWQRQKDKRQKTPDHVTTLGVAWGYGLVLFDPKGPEIWAHTFEQKAPGGSTAVELSGGRKVRRG